MEGKVHKPSSASDHYVVDIRIRRELGAADQHRRIFPHSEVLEEIVCHTGTRGYISGQRMVYISTHLHQGI